MMEHTLIPDFPMRDALLGVIGDNKGSDFYYTVGAFPAVKISGELIMINEEMEIITPEQSENFAKSLITKEQHEQLLRTKNLDFSFEFHNYRFR
jgi:Tfp pilus assembly pilus retraction ATPase PilT